MNSQQACINQETHFLSLLKILLFVLPIAQLITWEDGIQSFFKQKERGWSQLLQCINLTISSQKIQNHSHFTARFEGYFYHKMMSAPPKRHFCRISMII